MSEAVNDNWEEEAPGPSLAVPPLYVMRAAAYCPQCQKAQHVYTLGCAAFQDAEEGYLLEEFHMLNFIRRLPDAILALLAPIGACYRFDHPAPGGDPYMMNHCACGAKLDDYHLHGDVGAAFWPDTPWGFAAIRLFRLPVEQAIQVECNYTLGGSEYLDFARADPW